MQTTDLPDFFPKPFAANAAAGYIREIPEGAQPGGAASLTEGFPPLTFQPVGSGGVPPDGRDVNGILFQVSAWARWLSSGASAQFDADFAAAIGGYPKFSLLASTIPGRFWQSDVDNNTGNPDIDPANWLAVIPSVATSSQVAAGAAGALYVTPEALALAIGNGVGQTMRLPGGKIYKDGTDSGSRPSDNTYAVSFTTPFPGACRTVSLTGLNGSSSSAKDSWPQLVSKSASGFVYYVQSGGNPGTNPLDGVDWIAVGY